MIKKIQHSLGTQINIVLGAVVILFIVFSVYNRSLINQFQYTYINQINLYHSVLELKNTFSNCNASINNYFQSGNKTELATFNDYSDSARQEMQQLSSVIENKETVYLLSSIENAFSTYFSECCMGSFMYNTENLYYYDKMFYAQNIQEYLSKYCDELLQFLLEDAIETSKELNEKQQRMIKWNGFVITSIVVLFFSFMAYITFNVIKPLNELVFQAQEISRGNLDVKVKHRNSKSTVGILTKAFNDMAKNIKIMLESIRENIQTEKKLLEEQRKNIEYQKLLNQATFLALQTQINPHFLFNTLNSISRTITLGKQEQSITMIDSLAGLLRYSLTNVEVPVTIGQEIKITNHYLMIQKLRFSDRIQAEVICEEGLESKVMIPRFILQPLVENAIIHGLESKEEGGKILIKVQKKGEYCYIKIGDNGVGISKEKLQEMMTRKPENTSKNIGIWNTKERIELFTDMKNSFQIKSKVNRGTVVTIMIFMGETKNV